LKIYEWLTRPGFYFRRQMKSVPNDESKEVTGSPDRRQLERRGLFENDQQLKTARSDLQAARV